MVLGTIESPARSSTLARHTDALGSVYAWVDRSGSQVSTYSYDVYGIRTQNSGGVNVAWGYTGREHDRDTGLNYNRDRRLSPMTGIWTQPDRLGTAAGMNYYEYGSDSPAQNIDPYGQRVFGIGLEVDAQLLFFGFSISVMGVYDDHGGIGILITPASRTLADVSLAGGLAGFYNPEARDIRSISGLGLGLGVDLLVVGVGAVGSLGPVTSGVDANGLCQDTSGFGLETGGAVSLTAGLSIGIYLAIGYSFLIVMREPSPS